MLQVYTDGSCIKNGLSCFGGWGLVILNGNQEYFISGYEEENTTNNRMELQSVIESLKFIFKNYNIFHDKKIMIYSDSKLTINCAQNIWKRNKNIDLWKEYDILSKSRNIEFTWVKAHNGNKYNELADKLAYSQATRIMLRNNNNLI